MYELVSCYVIVDQPTPFPDKNNITPLSINSYTLFPEAMISKIMVSNLAEIAVLCILKLSINNSAVSTYTELTNKDNKYIYTCLK